MRQKRHAARSESFLAERIVQVARRKNKKKSHRSSRAPKLRIPVPEFDWEQVKRFLNVFAWISMIGGSVLLWNIAAPPLQSYAQQTIAPRDLVIEFVDRPAWLSGAIHDEITQLARAQTTRDPFDHGQLERIREVLQLTGWFLSVDRVARIAPDRIDIHASYIEPFAEVRDHSGDHLVDRAGRLISGRFAFNPDVHSIVLIGARAERPWSYGEVWAGPDIQAGLDLVTLLLDHEWTPQVASIDLSRYATTETLWINTASGARIRWGRAPGREHGAEVPASQKLQYLERMHSEFGSIDNGYSTLDITGDKLIAG